MTATLALALAAAAAVAVLAVLAWRRRRLRRRQAALTRLLDLADAVERLLDRSQERMGAMQSVVERVPADMGAVAQAALGSALPIREAKRDVLQHRLWIKQHGDSAAQAELDAAGDTLERVRQRLAAELGALEQAGADLAKATHAAEAAALREPPTLRRSPQESSR